MLCAMRSAEFEFGKGRITQDSDWGDRNVVIPLWEGNEDKCARVQVVEGQQVAEGRLKGEKYGRLIHLGDDTLSTSS